MKYFGLFLISVVLFGFKIPEGLPATWNQDLSFTLFHKGGMKPVNWSYRIYKDSSVFEKEDVINQIKTKKTFRFSKKDQKNLLEVLRKNKALSINSVYLHGTPVYDKPSFGFMIECRGKKYQAVSGELEEIEAPNKEEFDIIYSYTQEVLQKKIK